MARRRVDHLSRVTLFFFSSRRRHTRLTCDWSSDVCSSDLHPTLSRARERGKAMRAPPAQARAKPHRAPTRSPSPRAHRSDSATRSEERRVGKEGRARGARDNCKKDDPECADVGAAESGAWHDAASTTYRGSHFFFFQAEDGIRD